MSPSKRCWRGNVSVPLLRKDKTGIFLFIRREVFH